MPRQRLSLASVSIALFASCPAAQDPRADLLLDIRQDFYTSEVRSEFLQSGAWSWFVASTNGSDHLYRTDGTPAGTALFADLDPDSRMSIRLHAAAGGRLFFSAHAVGQGQSPRLWVSDGTVAGTEPLQFGSAGLAVRAAFSFGNRLVFLGAEIGTLDTEPWITDGTTAGTQRLADIVPGPTGSFASEFHLLVPEPGTTASRFWFTAFDPLSRRPELWSTDGSPAGTRRETSIPAPLVGPFGSAVSGPGLFVATGYEQTAASTRRLLRIEAGVGLSQLPIPPGVTIEHEVLGAGGRAFVATVDASAALVTDGTVAGTRAVALQGPPKDGASLLLAERRGDVLLAYPSSGTWQLARVAAGTDTAVALGVLPGPPFPSRNGSVWLGERLALLCETALRNRELFVVDPRFGRGAAHQSLVREEVLWLASHFGRALVTALDPNTRRRLPWVSDGTAAGTGPLSDLPGALLPTGSGPEDFVSFGTRAVFLARRSDVGREPWITDGTPQGTSLLVDLEPGRQDADIDAMLEVSDELWIARGSRIEALSGPLAAGAQPRLVTQLPASHYDFLLSRLVAFGDGVLLPARELLASGWVDVVLRIDRVGTITRALTTSSAVSAVVSLGEQAIAIQHLTNGSWDLWLFDGTAAGSRRLGNVPTPSGGRTSFVRFADALWLNTGAGTFIATTQGVTAFAPWSFQIERLVVAGQRRLYAFLADGTLRATDGTIAGSVRVVPGARVDPDTLTPLGANLLLARGNELVVTDGTTAGTTALADLGPSDTVQIHATGAQRAFVVAGDPTRGNSRRLWITDGTVAGTRSIQQLSPAQGPSVTTRFGSVANGRLILAVSDPQLGSEPYVLDPGSAQRTLGAPCAGGGTATPRLHASGDPRLGTLTTLEAASDGALVGWLALGIPALRAVAIPPSRCAWWIEPGSVTAVGPLSTTAGGTFRAPLLLPNTTALLGVRVVAQAVFATGRGPLGVDLSPGLLLQLGR